MKVMNLLKQNLNLYIIHIIELIHHILLLIQILFYYRFRNILNVFFRKIMLVKDIWQMKLTMQYICSLMLMKSIVDDDDNVWDNLLLYIDQMRSLKDSKQMLVFREKNKQLFLMRKILPK